MAQASTSSAQPGNAHAASKLRHEFYQTDSHVVVSVFIKNVKKEDCTSDIQPRSLSLTIKLPTGSETVFDLDPLARHIDPAASSVRVMSTKIEASLKKSSPGIKWNKLEGDEESGSSAAGVMNSGQARKGSSYPSSAKHKGDWDAIAREVQEEEDKPSASGPDKDPNASGDRDLNALFQQIYAGASDEQRMAMMKSYQESNGTTLSTDWNDVKKGKVTTKPPEGVNARDWSGKDAHYEERDKDFMSWASGSKKATSSKTDSA